MSFVGLKAPECCFSQLLSAWLVRMNIPKMHVVAGSLKLLFIVWKWIEATYYAHRVFPFI